MNAFARFEELIDEQGYSLRAALAQVNKESGLNTATFNGKTASFDDIGSAIVDNSDVMLFFMNHQTFA